MTEQTGRAAAFPQCLSRLQAALTKAQRAERYPSIPEEVPALFQEGECGPAHFDTWRHRGPLAIVEKVRYIA